MRSCLAGLVLSENEESGATSGRSRFQGIFWSDDLTIGFYRVSSGINRTFIILHFMQKLPTFKLDMANHEGFLRISLGMPSEQWYMNKKVQLYDLNEN